MDNLWNMYGKSMENLWIIYGKSMENLWKIYGKSMDNLWISYGYGWWLTYPSEKYESQLEDDYSKYMENKKCSKPPTRNSFQRGSDASGFFWCPCSLNISTTPFRGLMFVATGGKNHD